jgi:hypothetical protein
MRADNHKFPKNGSKIFFAQGLDRPNQIEMSRENFGFGATILERSGGLSIERPREFASILSDERLKSTTTAWRPGKASFTWLRDRRLAHRNVGWWASPTAHAGFVFDALDKTLHDRRPVHRGGLIHHSDRGVQYVPLRLKCSRQLRQRARRAINGLCKAEVIHRARKSELPGSGQA